MVKIRSDGGCRLTRVFAAAPGHVAFSIRTDASPYGMGRFLCQVGKPVAFWADELREEELKLFKAEIGDPSFQTEWELLAILVSLRVFSEHWPHDDLQPTQVIVETDNTAALQAALNFQASSPIMQYLAAEVALELESQTLDMLWGTHIRGVANHEADALSRLSQGAAIPSSLRHVNRLEVPLRDSSFFRAWPTE